MAVSGILETSEFTGKGFMSFAICSAYQKETIYVSSYEQFVPVFIFSIPSPVSPGHKFDEETNCDSFIDNRLHFIFKRFYFN